MVTCEKLVNVRDGGCLTVMLMFRTDTLDGPVPERVKLFEPFTSSDQFMK